MVSLARPRPGNPQYGGGALEYNEPSAFTLGWRDALHYNSIAMGNRMAHDYKGAALSEDEFNELGYSNYDIEYEAGASREQYEDILIRRRQEMQIGKKLESWTDYAGFFAGNIVGEALEPLNYIGIGVATKIPKIGMTAARIARSSKLGQKAATGAIGATAPEVLKSPLYVAQAQELQEDGLALAATSIAASAAFGGILGTALPAVSRATNFKKKKISESMEYSRPVDPKIANELNDISVSATRNNIMHNITKLDLESEPHLVQFQQFLDNNGVGETIEVLSNLPANDPRIKAIAENVPEVRNAINEMVRHTDDFEAKVNYIHTVLQENNNKFENAAVRIDSDNAKALVQIDNDVIPEATKVTGSAKSIHDAAEEISTQAKKDTVTLEINGEEITVPNTSEHIKTAVNEKQAKDEVRLRETIQKEIEAEQNIREPKSPFTEEKDLYIQQVTKNRRDAWEVYTTCLMEAA